MPSPLVNASDLLTAIPITTITEEVEYSEIAMATVARALHGLSAVTLPAKKEFVSGFLKDLQPWLPTTQQGRMSKRIAAYMFKRYKESVETRLLETIGTYLGQNSPSGPWMFDITNNLNWKGGDFGDHDACFMSNRRYVLDAMMEDGCTAIRFYDQLEKPLGVGRAWIAPSEHGPVIFNAYGPQLDLVKGRISQLLPNEPLSFVSLTNQGSAHGQLYINQSIAVLVGGSKDTRAVNIEIITGSQRPVRCANCGERTQANRMRHVNDVDDHQLRVCQACCENYYAESYFGGGYYRKELMELVEVVTPGDVDGWDYKGEAIKVWVFPGTITDYHRCDRCQRLMSSDLYISTGGETQHWCYLCAHDAPLECRECSYYLPASESKCLCGSTNLRKRGDRWA